MRKGNTRDTPAAELAERASALLAATAVLALLLLSTLLPAEGKRLMANLTAPVGIASANTSEAPLPDTEPSLADVDADIPSAVYARLLKITAEVLDKPSSLILGEDGPQILIYHTHDTEAYTQTAGHEYVPSGDWRTEDASCSVIAVGEELARILNEDYGIETIHDTTRHEPPLITTAYTRSLETMLAYKQQYPSLKMFIDLHRDGVGSSGYEDDYVVIDGVRCARLMFVVGAGRNSAGTEEDPKPDLESNYALALGLTQRLLSYNENFCRSVRVKSGRYNQHVSNKCILVEVGHNANTLEQALASMPYLAAAIAETAGVPAANKPISFSPRL